MFSNNPFILFRKDPRVDQRKRSARGSAPGGFAALLTIVIIGAAALLMARNASLLGLGELDLGYTSQKGEEAFSVADGCMEEALRRLRINTTYPGGTLSVSNGSCTITVAGIDPNRTVTVTGTVAGTNTTYNKKIEVTLTISSGNVLTILTWQELST